jgi:hypothetical protein
MHTHLRPVGSEPLIEANLYFNQEGIEKLSRCRDLMHIFDLASISLKEGDFFCHLSLKAWRPTLRVRDSELVLQFAVNDHTYFASFGDVDEFLSLYK